MIWPIILLLSLKYSEGILDEYTITPVKYNTGLYYEKLQPLRLYGTQWKLVTSLELAAYLNEEPEILKHSKQAEELCVQRGLTPCPTQEFVPGILRKLEDSKKYSTMLQAMLEEHKFGRPGRTRISRSAPLSFIGTISKVLFGTLTEEDETRYNEALDDLYSGTNKLAEITANQTQILRSEFNDIHIRIQNLTAQTRTLFQKSETIVESLQETQKAVRRSRIEGLIRTWMQTLDTAVEKYQAHLIIIVDAILFARQGILHPAVLSPKQLLTAAQKIRNTTAYEFPLTPTELLSQQTNGITDLRISYSKGRMIFLLTVPLLDQETFNLYKIHPNPSTQNYASSQLTVYIKPRSPYVATTVNGKTYILPNTQYIQNCFHHHKQYICQAFLPRYKTESHPICELELLRNPNPKTWEKCDVQVSLLPDEIWEPLESKQTWLYYAKTERRVQFFCNGRSMGIDYIHNAGLIHLKPGCMATTESTQVQAMNTVTTYREQLYAPEIALNLTQLAPDFSKPHLEILETLSHKHETGEKKVMWLETNRAISLKKLEQEARKIQDHRKLIHHFHAGIISGGSILILLVIAGAIFGILKLRPFLAKRTSLENDQETTVTGQSAEALESKPPLTPAPREHTMARPALGVI